MSVLKLQVIGNLGKDATSNNVNGKGVINFSVAHSEKWTDAKGNKMEKNTWVSVSYWTDKQGILPYLKKGTLVCVEGTPEATVYKSNDGTAKAELKVKAITVNLLGAAKTSEGGGSTATTTQATETPSAAEQKAAMDDLPF